MSRIYKFKKDLGYVLKVNRIWFVVGFPKGNLPRLEADITNIFILTRESPPNPEQIEIQFENVIEVTK